MSDSFAADWLALRATADARARASTLVDRLAPVLSRRAGGCVLNITDLGAGAGNNLAYLAPMLADHGLARQRWRLVDADAALLAKAAERRMPDGIAVETAEADLAADLDASIGRETDLVTASALIDLAGSAWIERLAAAVFARRLPVLIVLSYDGRQAWAPPHPADDAILAAFNTDQRRDKGLGPSLGPDAHDYLYQRLVEAGFIVEDAASDWTLSAPADAALIAELAKGTGQALEPHLGAEARDWATARQTAERAMIGHRDLLAWPPDGA
ncbi:MAG: class I SAM-dependent methyltransferase [Pseudomonadota bacterium]